jgi:outer membrane protein TolC
MQSNQRRLFDEGLRIPQSSPRMKSLGILLILAGTIVAATAQTNAPGARMLSLEDCLQRALEKNLDLRIARYNSPMAASDLQNAYAGYDPNLSIGGQHEFRMSGGGFYSAAGIEVPFSTTSDANSFNGALANGLLPTGLKYNLSGGASEIYGNSQGPFDSANGSASINLTQPLLKNFWIDPTRFSIKVAKNRVKYSELQLKQSIMSVITTVEQAYYDLIYDRENIAVQEKAVQLATQLVVENKKRVEVGALAPLRARRP